MRRLRLAVLLLLGFLHCAPAQGFTPVPFDQLFDFQLAPQSLTTQFVIDVPEGARQLSVEIDSLTPGVDVDLLLRHGSPFRFDQPDIDALFDQAQYFSSGPGGDEFLVLSDQLRYPVQAGRWYLAILNLSSQTAQVRGRVLVSAQSPQNAPIVLDFNRPGENCDVNEWTPERRAALEHAAQRVAQALRSTIPVRVRACWRDYGEDSTTLASASPNGYFRSFPATPRRNTFFSRPTVARQAATPLCKLAAIACDSHDLTITFNTRVDDPSRPVFRRWNYSIEESATSNGFDFVTVAMHEILHGLGFAALVRPTTGELLGAPYDEVYAYHSIYEVLGQPPRRLTELDSDAERLQALTSSLLLTFDALYERDPLFNPGVLERIPLYAPPEVAGGSTLSHLRDDINPPQLMFPSQSAGVQRRTLGLAERVMHRVGWDPSPKSSPAIAQPLIGQWFDIGRNGHGIEFARVADTWVMTFYSYDGDGWPEYFQAVGPLVDGRFLPLVQDYPLGNGGRNSQNSLLRYLYDPARVGQGLPPQFPDPDPAYLGRVALDFVDPDTYPECRDGLRAQRPTDDGLAVMRWRIEGSGPRVWCLAPLLPSAVRPAQDFTGLWYAGPGDTGFGFSITNARLDGRDLMIAILYYPDAAGRGRWVYGFSEDWRNGDPIPLLQRRAYCRTCPQPPGTTPWTDRVVGELVLELVQPAFHDAAAGNRARFHFNVPDGPAAGRFERSFFPLLLLTEPVSP
jgi:hypothetical protein